MLPRAYLLGVLHTHSAGTTPKGLVVVPPVVFRATRCMRTKGSRRWRRVDGWRAGTSPSGF